MIMLDEKSYYDDLEDHDLFEIDNDINDYSLWFYLKTTSREINRLYIYGTFYDRFDD